MSKKLNGKTIKLGDVVTIHGAKEYWSNSPLFAPEDFTSKLYGNIGVVVGFGCVVVECLPTPKNRDDGDPTVKYYFDASEIEVIGKL
jgi:hypothetical protein